MLKYFSYMSQESVEENKVEGKKSYFGTLQYMPPEFFQKNQYNFASDCWALGCFLYELVLGITPFYHKI